MLVSVVKSCLQTPKSHNTFKTYKNTISQVKYIIYHSHVNKSLTMILKYMHLSPHMKSSPSNVGSKSLHSSLKQIILLYVFVVLAELPALQYNNAKEISKYNATIQ